MLTIQRTMTTTNRQTTSTSTCSKRVLLLSAELVVMLQVLLCFNDSSTYGLLQQPTTRRLLTSESIQISSIRGGGGGGGQQQQQYDRNLAIFGIVCNICVNSILISPDTLIPGQNNISCSTLDSMAQDRSFRRGQCRKLQYNTEITSLCCDSTTVSTISPTTSQSPTSSSITSSPTITTITPTTSPSTSTSSPSLSPKTSSPVAAPNSTSTTISTTSDSKQGISSGAIVPIIIVVIILVGAVGYYFIWKNKSKSNNTDNNNDDNVSVKQEYFDTEDDAATMGFLSFKDSKNQKQKVPSPQQQESKTKDAEHMKKYQQMHHPHHDIGNDNSNGSTDNRLPAIISVASTSTNTGISGSTTSINEEGAILFEKTIILPCSVLGLVLETDSKIQQPIIDEISIDSPLKDSVTVGDIIISIHGTNTHSMTGQEVATLLGKTSNIPDRIMIVLSSTKVNDNKSNTTKSVESTSGYNVSTTSMSTIQISMYTTGTFDKENGQSIISSDNVNDNSQSIISSGNMNDNNENE